ncbi:MAG: hypothetical protein GEU81_04400 [Nitriliruptorales bacterium]|nr:hypothetical protein [Nitriliruptorales bacterium]
MRVTVLVSSRPRWALDVVTSWARDGDSVTVVLLAGASGAARPGHPAAETLAAAQSAGVVITAHDEALHRRALGSGVLVEGIKPIDLDEMADLVTSGADKAVWW